MSKSRKVAKYTIAGTLSTMYGLAVLNAKQKPAAGATDKTWMRHGAVAGVLTAATWLIATL